jgi:hypothetical protein
MSHVEQGHSFHVKIWHQWDKPIFSTSSSSSSSSVTTMDVANSHALDDQDESVRIAIRALGDMRNSVPTSSPSTCMSHLVPFSHPFLHAHSIMGRCMQHFSLPQHSPYPQGRRRPHWQRKTRRTLSRACPPSPLSTLRSRLMCKERPARGWSRCVPAYACADTCSGY